LQQVSIWNSGDSHSGCTNGQGLRWW